MRCECKNFLGNAVRRKMGDKICCNGCGKLNTVRGINIIQDALKAAEQERKTTIQVNKFLAEISEENYISV